ncbi:MAG: glycosyltransferase family 2 protein [Coxiellaceae bacterium]|nr:glycosyltransferase family 2 protein [Coxiellaceae bacterium]
MKPIRYAVLIPAFNEEATIRDVVENSLRFCKNIIVVDDGSLDRTVEKIQDLPITILRNSINRGKDASLLRGMAHIQKLQLDAVITMDADKQHNPNDLPRFVAAQQHYPHNIIIGARRINTKNAPRLKLLASKTADFFISWAAGKKILDTQSGFRLYPNSYIPRILRKSSRNNHFVFESQILIDATRKAYTPVSLAIESIYPDDARKSYYRPMMDTSRIILMICWELLTHGLNPKGLFAAIFRRNKLIDAEKPS